MPGIITGFSGIDGIGMKLGLGNQQAGLELIDTQLGGNFEQFLPSRVTQKARIKTVDDHSLEERTFLLGRDRSCGPIDIRGLRLFSGCTFSGRADDS